MKAKKIILILITITLTFNFMGRVSAANCEYKYKGKTITINTTKDPNTGFISTETIVPGKYDAEPFDFIDESIFVNEDQCLETITVCEMEKGSIPDSVIAGSAGVAAGVSYAAFPWGLLAWVAPAAMEVINAFSGENFIAVFGSSLDPTTTDSAIAYEFDDISDKGFWEAAFWTGSDEFCKTAEYSKSDKQEMKENGNFISYCGKFLSMYTNISSAYQNYAMCEIANDLTPQQKTRCQANAYTKINKEVDKLKQTCNNILQNSGINVKDGCAKSCLGVNDVLKTLKNRYGIAVKKVTECGFSSRLTIWASNIIRWVKYIIPVIVIIFGILDFIKATGTSKEDEIKKAQGKFIKRLIAAALIFIAPFIIQFILEQMGFAANGCGVIDL